MYLNLGPNKTVKKTEVVGIFDIDIAGATKSTKDFLVHAEKEKKAHSAGGDLPKSFVLLDNGEVWFSPYAAKILKRRGEHDYFEVTR